MRRNNSKHRKNYLEKGGVAKKQSVQEKLCSSVKKQTKVQQN